MTNEMIMKEVASKYFNVKNDDVSIVNRLMGGMSNYTYVIEINGKKYTFRIPGKNAEKFVDRDVEKHHIDLVDDLSLNNKTVYLDVDSGYKIAEYIDGTPLNELDPLQYLEQAAKVLHTIHKSGKVSEFDYDPLGRLKRYEDHTKAYDHVHCDRYVALKERFLSYKDMYLDTKRYTLTHGDSQISNFVDTGNELRLMDWEFTGNNDPLYDVACFGNNNFDHALALLPVYLGREPLVEEYNRMFTVAQRCPIQGIYWFKC